eukprot:31237-Pelagococcus_subviridis.AAC.2
MDRSMEAGRGERRANSRVYARARRSRGTRGGERSRARAREAFASPRRGQLEEFRRDLRIAIPTSTHLRERLRKLRLVRVIDERGRAGGDRGWVRAREREEATSRSGCLAIYE